MQAAVVDAKPAAMRDAQTSTALGLENVTTSAAQAWALAAAAQSAGTAHTRLLKPAQLPIIVTARNYRCRTRPDESHSSLSPGVQPPLCCQPLQMLGKGPSSFLKGCMHICYWERCPFANRHLGSRQALFTDRLVMAFPRPALRQLLSLVRS